MPDYETMYHKLFNSITDTIHLLQQAQEAVEEMYISDEDQNDNENGGHD